MSQDLIKRFLFKEHSIRGQRVQLEDAWQKMLADRHYPAAVSKLLGELTAVSVILAGGLKHRGKITLQIQGKGPVNLLVVEVTHEFKLRGVAKTSQTISHETTMDELLGDGQILVTLENTQTNHHYQSYVPRDGDTIAACFEEFFQQSEQLPSKLYLDADDSKLGGVLLQKMPDTDQQDADAWNRILMLAETVKSDELLELDTETLLQRLFHEEVIELFDAGTVLYECPQDRERVDKMLISLGEAEVRKILEEQDEIVIHNEICNFHLRYDEAAVNALFSANDDNETLQ